MKKTITVFGATGTAGSACVDELLLQGVFQPRVLVRKRRPGLPRKLQTKNSAFTTAGRAAALRSGKSTQPSRPISFRR